MTKGQDVWAVGAAVVTGLLAGAVASGGASADAVAPALLLGCVGLAVAGICLLGVRQNHPWWLVVLAAALFASFAVTLVAHLAIDADEENLASLVSSAVLAALFGAGCAALVGLIVRHQDRL
jgi:tellurite resistance protein TehA-like permease